MRTTITLDDDIYEAALHLSEESGESFSRAVSTLARRGLQSHAGNPRRKFSTVELPDDTAKLVLAHISKAIEDEGL